MSEVNQLHGFIKDMPNDDYHRSKGVSKTGLDKISRSPAHYRWPKKGNSTRNMEIGTAIHAAILEPVRFDKEYCLTECQKRTEKAYRDAAKIHTGELTLTGPEAKNVTGMRESVEQNLEAMQYLADGGEPELSAFITDPETGITIRCRYDFINLDKHICVDLKKTQDVRKFGRSVADYRYHVQDAMYSYIYKQITGHDLTFLFLAVEEDSPHTSKIFECDDLAKEIGYHYFRKDLRTYAKCKEADYWPHAEIDGLIELPNWEVSKFEESLEVII